MKRLASYLLTLLLSIMVITMISCRDDDDDDVIEPEAGKLVFKFEHKVDGQAAQYDTLIYTNEAGNQYLINEIQYFITDVTLHKSDGTTQVLDDWNFYHYVDKDIPATMEWSVFDPITPGSYDSISFTFGFNEIRNQSFMFVNPPEVNMFWPEYLGGGYHYLKLNVKWIDTASVLRGCAWHLGIGQSYSTPNVPGPPWFHNYFNVTLPSSSFTIADQETKEVMITMNVDEWFKDPNTYNFNDHGSDIMQNQTAMALGAENGHNVFTTGYIQ